MSNYTCPGCAKPMERHGYERKTVGQVDLDLCFSCHGIWFDQYESAQLTPGSVIRLFGQIHEHHGEPRQTLGDRLSCPQCSGKLSLTHDVQRTNRISYYRCVEGHGRFTTFSQFLLEKNFVRSLSPMEVEKLKVTMKQVRCSSCGAPVDLARDAQCGYCRAPLAILDAEAVKTALADLSAAERKRQGQGMDPGAAVDAVLAGKTLEPKARPTDSASRYRQAPQTSTVDTGFELADLVEDAIGILFD